MEGYENIKKDYVSKPEMPELDDNINLVKENQESKPDKYDKYKWEIISLRKGSHAFTHGE